MRIGENFHNQHIYIHADQHSRTDNDYTLKLQGALKGKYAIVLVGHSGSGYREDSNALRDHIRTLFKEIMASHQPQKLNADDVVVIAGGTPQGIGISYDVADEMNIDTLGVVAIQGKKYASPYCKTFITIQNQDNNDWTTRMPESGDEMVVAAIRIAKDIGKGGELLAYNGGPQAYAEALSAAKDGHSVTLIRDFKPVDTNREQPFYIEQNLYELQNAGVKFHER